MARRTTLAAAAAALCLASCGPPGGAVQPYFTLEVTYKLENSTCSALETCSSLGITRIVASLFEAQTGTLFLPGFAASCGQGLVGGEGGAPDGGMNAIEITGYGSQLYDLYVQAFDASGKLVAFGKALSAVPANVPDKSVIPIPLVLSQPIVAGCGDGNAAPADGGPKKTCDDFGNNTCSNCGVACPAGTLDCNVCKFSCPTCP